MFDASVLQPNSALKSKRQRHRFSPQIKAKLTALCKLDNWHGPIEVAEDSFVIAIAIAFPYLFDIWSTTWWLAWFFVSLPLIGTRQRALAELLHQSAHGTLAQNKGLNFILGTLTSGYLVVQSRHTYRNSHVLNHHVDLGAPNDPDTTYHRKQGLYDRKTKLSFVWQYLIAPLLLLKTPSKLIDLFRHRLLSSDEPGWERALKLSYMTALVVALVWAGLGVELFLFWIIPFVLVFPVVNWFVELCEHYPFVVQHDVDVFMTRNRWTGILTKFFLGIHAENYHLVHHLDPRIPAWNLPKAHLIMMEDPIYRAAQFREIGLLWSVVPGIPTIFGSITDKAAICDDSSSSEHHFI